MLTPLACAGALLLTNLRLGTAVSSSSGIIDIITSSGIACQSEITACLADDACAACMSGPEPTDFCSSRYPDSYNNAGGENAGYDYCDATGANYCCDYIDIDTADQCLTNQASISYWTCKMMDEGCQVFDMPCYATGAVESTAPPAPTPAPTPEYFITTSSIACQSEISACLADDTCNACMSGAESTITCSSRYPDSFYNTAGGEGLVYDYCDSTAAYYCCDYVDSETAERCLTNQASISYWTCKMTDEGCEISDMPCYTTGAAESTTTPVSPTTPPMSSTSPPVPSTTPPAASTTPPMLTPSPIGTVEAGPIAPTPAPMIATVDFADSGGRKMADSPQRFALTAVGLLAVAAAGLVVV